MNSAVAAFFVAFLFFLIAVHPSVDWFDGGELIQAGFLLDSTHPPGHPFYIFLAKLATFVPIGSIDFRINILSALTTAAAIAVAARLLHKSGSTLVAIIVFALFLSMHPAILLQANRTEVYGLNLLTTLLIIYTLQQQKLENRYNVKTACFLLLFIFGLSLANHHFLTLLVTPFIGLHFILMRAKGALLAKHLLWGGFFLLLGLATYLFLPIRALSPHLDGMGWGNPVELANLMDLLRARDFAINVFVPWQDWNSVWQAMCAVRIEILVLTAFAIALMLRKKKRAWWPLIFLLPFLFGGTLINYFNPENPDQLGYLSGVVVVSTMMIFYALPPLIPERIWQGRLRSFSPVVILVLGGALLYSSKHPLFRGQARLTDAYTYDFTKHASYGATLLARSDHTVFPLSCMQNVFGLRRDVQYVALAMFDARWYREYIQRRYPDFAVAVDRGKMVFADDARGRLYAENFDDLFAAADVILGPQDTPEDDAVTSKEWVQPWYHWYRLSSNEIESGSALEDTTSQFIAEYVEHPHRYRLTGGHIFDAIHRQRGFYFDRQGNFEAAVRHFEVAADVQPATVETNSTSKIVSSLLPLPASTQPVFISSDAENLYTLGTYYLMGKNIKAAEAVFMRASKLGKQDGLILLADRAFRQGKETRAIKFLKRIKKDPAEKLIGIGIIYLGQGNLDLAEHYLQRGLQKRPDVGANIYLARIEKSRGRIQAAENYVKQALQIEPDNLQIQRELESIRFMRQRGIGRVPEK